MKTQLLAAPLVLLALILLGGCAPQKAQSFSELVKNGTPQAVKAAIEKGAYVNASDEEDTTVLMYATAITQPGSDHHAPEGWRRYQGS